MSPYHRPLLGDNGRIDPSAVPHRSRCCCTRPRAGQPCALRGDILGETREHVESNREQCVIEGRLVTKQMQLHKQLVRHAAVQRSDDVGEGLTGACCQQWWMLSQRRALRSNGCDPSAEDIAVRIAASAGAQ